MFDARPGSSKIPTFDHNPFLLVLAEGVIKLVLDSLGCHRNLGTFNSCWHVRIADANDNRGGWFILADCKPTNLCQGRFLASENREFALASADTGYSLQVLLVMCFNVTYCDLEEFLPFVVVAKFLFTVLARISPLGPHIQTFGLLSECYHVIYPWSVVSRAVERMPEIGAKGSLVWKLRYACYRT